MKNFFERLKEPSSWAGIAVISLLVGMPIPASIIDGMPQAIATISALVALFVKEKS